MANVHGRLDKVFLVVMGITIFVSLSHLAGVLKVDIAKATLHHQLDVVGTPTHLCDAHTLHEAKEAGMVPKNSRAFRLVPLQYVTKVVDAFPLTWGFLRPSLDLLSAMAPTPPSGMPPIPMPPPKQANLAASHLEVSI